MKEKIMKLLKWMTTENASLTFIGFGFLILLVAIIVFLGNFAHLTTSIDSEKLDHFGSFISGLVGSLWSLASFILLYVSLQQQKADVKLTNEALTLQIEEFKQQKIELEGTKIALEEQNKTQQLQQFETTFFNLLSYYNYIISVMSFDPCEYGSGFGEESRNYIYKGKEALVAISDHIMSENIKGIIEIQREKNFKYKYHNLIPYFDHVETVLIFILTSNIPNPQFYVKLFVKILTKEEKKIILAHCFASPELQETISKISTFNDSFKQFPLYNEIFETPTSSEITS